MVARRADVARLAGTSPAVVSYVVNGGPRPVAAATRARVLAAMAQLDYRPNAVARSLRTNRTLTLGLVVPDAAQSFFAELAGSVEEAAYARGYFLLLGNAHDDPARETAYVRTFLDRGVDGLLVVPAHGSSAWFPDIARSGRPCSVLDRRVPGLTGVGQVLVDNVEGAVAATRHLLEHGRRRIGCISGPADIEAANERVLGWREANATAGIPSDGNALHRAPFTLDAGYDAAASIIAAHDIDALFVASDEQAFGALRAIKDAGRRCPDDVALVSFDGIAPSKLTVPSLTSMAQPFVSLAQAAVSSVLERIDDPDVDPTTTVLPLSLVRRESCGCAT